MSRWSKWIGVGVALGLSVALIPVVRGNVSLDNALSKIQRTSTSRNEAPSLQGLDLTRYRLRPQRVLAPLPEGRDAELTLDPDLQRSAAIQMKRYRIPEAAIVVIEVKTGRLLAYASYVNEGPKFDVAARAEAPAASVFKVITASALVEKANLNAGTEQCYHGGRSRITVDELQEDARRDKWCATMAIAMGRSLNVVFARLAQKHLTPEELTGIAGGFGFGAPVPFVAPNEASKIELPQEPVEFARSAAGFWHTSLSPLNAALIAQAIANGGVALEPRIVRAVYRGDDKLWEDGSEPRVLRRSVKPETAAEVGRMMLQTVQNGSAYSQFHDKAGRPYLPGISVAGKTGTLTREKQGRFYTWFVGYAPANQPEIAIASLAVNTPTWQIKAPALAREVLRSYFSKRGAAGVTPP